MPEYPDITIYVERLRAFLIGHELEKIRLVSPFLLRTAEPPIASLNGQTLERVDSLGKRIIFRFTGEFHLVLHLMIAGRLQWGKKGLKIPPKRGLAAVDFDHGSLLITEASTKKRASLHLVRGDGALVEFDRGGISVFDATLQDFTTALTAENHTLKRALTDPRILSGIGNAYSDEILHRARLSPLLLTSWLTDQMTSKLYDACRTVLTEWTDRLSKEAGDDFPKKVTAFRKEMAVHGKYGEPCPVCGGIVQRIRYASNETNYCPTCQTEGRLLADRSLSRLLKGDWPKTAEELEELKKPPQRGKAK